MNTKIAIALLLVCVLVAQATPVFAAPQDGPGAPPGPGNVIALGAYETFKAVSMVLRGVNGFIMQSPTGDFLFCWPRGAGTWGFVGISSSGKPIVDLANFTGNKAGTLRFADMIKYLETCGWKYVIPADVTAAVVSTFSSAVNFFKTVGSLNPSIPAFIFIVPGMFQLPGSETIQG